MKKICLLLVLFLSAGIFSSCNDDRHDYYEEYYIEDDMIGRTWTGNVGLRADNGEPLFSSFTFGRDGFGVETQYYTRDGVFYAEFNFSWRRTSDWRNDFRLDYGRYGVSFMEELQLYRGILSGVFYLDEASTGFPFRLQME